MNIGAPEAEGAVVAHHVVACQAQFVAADGIFRTDTCIVAGTGGLVLRHLFRIVVAVHILGSHTQQVVERDATSDDRRQSAFRQEVVGDTYMQGNVRLT